MKVAAPQGWIKDKDYILYQYKSFQQRHNHQLQNTPVNASKTVIFEIDVKMPLSRGVQEN